MAGFTTTDDGGWEFSFDDTPGVPDLPSPDSFVQQGPEVANYLAGPGKWENYTDDVMYEHEGLLRKWLDLKSEDKTWRAPGARGVMARKHTTGMVFMELYSRTVDMTDPFCQVRVRRLSRLLAYYSTKIQKCGSIHGKKVMKNIYHLSLGRYRKVPPYCLRHRLEWLTAKGEMPTWHNMQLPKDDLKPGHARNPKTNENMRRRRERGRELYNERYRDRAH